MATEIAACENGRTGLPGHVAVIMDGNGRWAERHGLPKYRGHEAGMDAMIGIVRHASDLGIRHLTVYAFSTENWKRGAEEVKGIFQLLLVYVRRELDELHRNNVKVDVFGDRGAFSKTVAAALGKTIEKTSKNTGLRFHICLNYGSRAEILAAAKAVCADAEAGRLGGYGPGLAGFDEEAFSEYLYSAGVPDPDLLIRPGGEKRISNFLLWQTAYSELVFSDVLWPDYTPRELDAAIEEYLSRKRRFGGRG
ncbi:MAG: di-trans,poly-cis-decaprenylcistransferase [Clostridiales Family XIII bacterium]|jgi:undecaprenyl diphosphate synthase|nr:di-trans,poly-cis-decaprenylcistransferase [Clostridiales Family XIII bacterium]